MDHLPNVPPRWVDGSIAGIGFGTVERTAARFTLFVGDVVDLFRKLEFERNQFSRAHHAHPPDLDGIVYNCLNFLVTAQSLYDWFKIELQIRAEGSFDVERFNALIADRVPYHGVCRDIANTLKHRDFRDGLWSGGRVKLDFLPGDDKIRPLAILVFDQPDGMNMDAHGLLDIIVMDWRLLLMEHGLLPNPNKPTAASATVAATSV